jgi:hypothetical protein
MDEDTVHTSRAPKPLTCNWPSNLFSSSGLLEAGMQWRHTTSFQYSKRYRAATLSVEYSVGIKGTSHGCLFYRRLAALLRDAKIYK